MSTAAVAKALLGAARRSGRAARGGTAARRCATAAGGGGGGGGRGGPGRPLRVLAFEDSFDVAELLASVTARRPGIQLEQRWSTTAALDVIRAAEPDVLLLDFYIPPATGLEVLESINAAVAEGTLRRPKHIIAMSSVGRCNSALLAAGADAAFIKFDVHSWDGWDAEGET